MIRLRVAVRGTVWVLLSLAVTVRAQTPLGSAFTYQGQLREAGAPVSDFADFKFSLWDALTNGSQIAATQSLGSVEVTNGLFTVWLDFGSAAFGGDARYLEIEVRVPAGSGSYTLLAPRQEIGAVPYALYALEAPGGSSDADTVDGFHASGTPVAGKLLALDAGAKFPNSVLNTGSGNGLDADLLDGQQGVFYRDASNLNAGTVPSARLAGAYSNALTLSNPTNVFVGDGAGLTGLNADSLATGTVADARLSSNVALLNNAQTFAGAKTFSVAPSFSAAGAPFSVTSTTLVSNLNADLLDGQTGAFYQNASNLNAGTLPDARLSGTYSSALSFSNATNSFVGSGAGLTGLNAGNIGTGTLSDARLSANVALLNNNQTFSGTKTFSAAPSFTYGGAPFTVSSPTVVANLNADLLDGQNGQYYRDATNINWGTLNDTRLSSNVALLDTIQTFSANKYFSGRVGIGNTAPSYPLQVETSSLTSAIYADNKAGSGSTYGIYGESDSTGGLGVYGRATATSGTTYGLYGRADSTNGRGVFGYAATSSGSNNYGVYGQADSPSGTAVCGVANATTGTPFAILGQCNSATGYAGYFAGRSYFSGNVGINTSTPSYPLHVETNGERAIYGYNYAGSGTTYGIYGRADSASGWAGYFQGRGYFTGNVGIGTTTPGLPLTFANTLGDKLSLYGQSGNHYGFGIQSALLQIHGDASNSDIAFGYGTSAAFTERMRIKGNGNVGIGTTSPTQPLHISGADSSGDGVLRANNTQTGSDAPAIYGRTAVTTDFGVGVKGVGNYFGMHGVVDSGGSTTSYPHRALYGQASGGTTTNYAVCAEASGGSTAYGIYASASGATTNYAGYFSGNATVTGTLSKGGGSFKIDHPLDPEHKYLYHSFVESPDMMNVYNGNVSTDAGGTATVTLPDWFEALNRDFRYQLTVIGQFAQAIVADELRDNQFVIRTDKPNVKVSWQVTGIRQDAFANANRIPVEEDKSPEERGKFLHPAAYDLPEELGIDYDRNHGETKGLENPPPTPPEEL